MTAIETTGSHSSKLLRVLDIDLDFFLSEKCTFFGDSRGRLDSIRFIPWKPKDVRTFLENQCNLTMPVSGQVFDTHDEVLSALKDIADNQGDVKFDIDHVDAHADLGLGLGDCSFMFIFTELLEFPKEERFSKIQKGGCEGLNEGNFLAYAIACQLVSKLSYIVPLEWANDIPYVLMKDFDTNAASVQLKFYGSSLTPLSFDSIKSIPVLHYEPEVPFQITDYKKFKATDKYDLIFLTKSPKYTPITSDKLLPVIKEYISIDV